MCSRTFLCINKYWSPFYLFFFSAFASTILVSLAFIENKHCCSQIRGLIGDLLHQCLPVVIRIGGETDSSSTSLSAMQIPTKFSSLSIKEAPSFFYIHPISDSPALKMNSCYWGREGASLVQFLASHFDNSANSVQKILFEEILNHLGGDPSCSSFCGSCVTPRCHQNENWYVSLEDGFVLCILLILFSGKRKL